MFDLNPVLARARLTYEWIQRDPCRKDDDWLPLSTREHFNTDVPAMVAELRAARELRAACGSFDPQRVAAALAAYDKVVG